MSLSFTSPLRRSSPFEMEYILLVTNQFPLQDGGLWSAASQRAEWDLEWPHSRVRSLVGWSRESSEDVGYPTICLECADYYPKISHMSFWYYPQKWAKFCNILHYQFGMVEALIMGCLLSTGAGFRNYPPYVYDSTWIHWIPEKRGRRWPVSCGDDCDDPANYLGQQLHVHGYTNVNKHCACNPANFIDG